MRSTRATAAVARLNERSEGRRYLLVMTGDGRFVEVQGTAEGEPFGDQELQAVLGLARAGIGELVALQRQALAE